ncbi:hypothetical protein [Bartonella sp. ML70XJBT.G]|uniref:hypothetical protein n=1 Tax=Bartonella sp. ML70XJBT.G TaxID=3019093 RepID=UPI0038573DFD
MPCSGCSGCSGTGCLGIGCTGAATASVAGFASSGFVSAGDAPVAGRIPSGAPTVGLTALRFAGAGDAVVAASSDFEGIDCVGAEELRSVSSVVGLVEEWEGRFLDLGTVVVTDSITLSSVE